jgi:translation initiation factor 2B subunit (eIF-2B alpha/beta/delta family)
MQPKSNDDQVLSRQSLLEAGRHQLQNDKTNGAQILATNAVKILQNIITSFEVMEALQFWTQIRLSAYHLSISRPSMGSAVTSALTQALAAIKDAWIELLGDNWVEALPNDLKEIAKTTLTSILLQRSQTAQLFGSQFSGYLLANFSMDQPLRILTLSSSSSLKHCLIQALGSISGLAIDLCILESRPRCEGATFGLNLLKTLHSELEICALSTDCTHQP